MVSVSPRLPNLDSDEESESFDHRFAIGFRSLSLESADFAHLQSAGYFESRYDTKPFADTPDSSASRRRRRQRRSDGEFEYAEPFAYQTVADGDLFRLMILHPGTGSNPIHCNLVWESARRPQRNYCCISYAWESVRRDAAILCDGFRFPVTSNLLRALQSLRKPKTALLLWADQICINQDDEIEKSHQVSIMKHIFNRAHKIYVWLGEADDRSEKLCEYAKRMRRGDEIPKSALNRLLSHREVRAAVQKFLQRPWFQRVWVIPEVALSSHTTVACGRSKISWDNLVRLIRDVSVVSPRTSNFDKQASLLGNARQRTAIITQMISSQKESRAHTDITQLLILAKSSKATDVRDMVYAFYGLTHLTTYPDYSRPAEQLYVEIIEMYINSIQWENSYSTWHDLTDAHKTFQLASILCSAGALHQHLTTLPSWVPDLTHAWHLAPVWCKTAPNFITNAARDDWTSGIRTAFRAGGTHSAATFELLPATAISPSPRSLTLRVAALIIDTLALVNELTPASTPGIGPDDSDDIDDEDGHDRDHDDDDDDDDNDDDDDDSPGNDKDDISDDSPTLRYGRHFFTTRRNHVGIATPGIAVGDVLVVIPGADVPFVLRPFATSRDGDDTAVATGEDSHDDMFRLLCEAYVQTPGFMRGEYFAAHADEVREVELV